MIIEAYNFKIIIPKEIDFPSFLVFFLSLASKKYLSCSCCCNVRMLLFVFSLGICSYSCYNYFLTKVLSVWQGDRQKDRQYATFKLKKSLFSLQRLEADPANRTLCKGQGIKDRNYITKLSLETVSSFLQNSQRPGRQVLTWQGEFLTDFLPPILFSPRVEL